MELSRGNPKDNFYKTNAEHTASLVIIKLTPTVIAGTFSGTAMGLLGTVSSKVITITDGRFDIKRK